MRSTPPTDGRTFSYKQKAADHRGFFISEFSALHQFENQSFLVSSVV